MANQPRLEICLIAALSEDGIIGTGHGGIPWKLPRDGAHFRTIVTGKSILLGRITYAEMAGWFRTERPIVLTSNVSFHPREKQSHVASSLEAALRIASGAGDTELFVCGGASVYGQALPLASRMILTHVKTRIGDMYPEAARFPAFDPEEWMIEREDAYHADEDNPYAMGMVWYRRRRE